MLLAILALEAILVLLAAAMLLRKQAPENPRQAAIPDQLTRLETTLQSHVERQVAQIRHDLAHEAQTSRTAQYEAAAGLRAEVLGTVQSLGQTLSDGLSQFRADNKQSAETLRTAIGQTLEKLDQRFNHFASDASRTQLDQQNALNTRLNELAQANVSHQERLRTSVETGLSKLNTDNSAKLEEMRATVDEKLHATLHTRLTESFGQVTDQLNKVHSGLGEMSKLSEGVDGLSRIFTNVKSRGGFAEVQLGMLLEQMLAPSQFLRNARVKPGSQEVVEFAVRFPGHTGETLLPIDAKFPREDWERLESAYAANDLRAARRRRQSLRSRHPHRRQTHLRQVHPPAADHPPRHHVPAHRGPLRRGHAPRRPPG